MSPGVHTTWGLRASQARESSSPAVRRSSTPSAGREVIADSASDLVDLMVGKPTCIHHPGIRRVRVVTTRRARLRSMELTSETFRKVMGHFATGVTVVTVLDGDRPSGITVNA